MDNLSKDEKLQITWVRCSPNNVIPFERLVSKYGAAEKCTYSEENFRPTCYWETKGIFVYLSDDKKFVLNVEYVPTEAEQNSALGIKKNESELPNSELSK